MKLFNVKPLMLLFVVIILGISGGLSYFASKSPDGLDRVAQDLGFSNQGKMLWTSAPAANYQVGAGNLFWQNGRSGWLGVALVFGLVWLWGRIVTKGKDRG